MKRGVLLVALFLLVGCAPQVQTRWVAPPGRNLAVDQGECRRRAIIAVPPAPYRPYQPYVPEEPTLYTSPYSHLGNALGQMGETLGEATQEIAQRDLYVTTCLESFGYVQEYL